MVLTGPQMNAFHLNPDQMGVTAAAKAQLAQEGLDSVDDLAEFDEKSLLQACKNARAAGHSVDAKSVSRLTTAIDLVKHCNAVGRTLTSVNVA